MWTMWTRYIHTVIERYSGRNSCGRCGRVDKVCTNSDREIRVIDSTLCVNFLTEFSWKLFEGFVANIDSKIQLYGLAKNSYNTQAVSTLMSENFYL